MSDIVERLRYAITTAHNDDTSGTGSDRRIRHFERVKTMEEAADEIERLRRIETAYNSLVQAERDLRRVRS